jgi:hypothetical protein
LAGQSSESANNPEILSKLPSPQGVESQPIEIREIEYKNYRIHACLAAVAQNIPFERPLPAFWLIKLGEATDQRLQLFEPAASFVIAWSKP